MGIDAEEVLEESTIVVKSPMFASGSTMMADRIWHFMGVYEWPRRSHKSAKVRQGKTINAVDGVQYFIHTKIADCRFVIFRGLSEKGSTVHVHAICSFRGFLIET